MIISKKSKRLNSDFKTQGIGKVEFEYATEGRVYFTLDTSKGLFKGFLS